LFLLALERVDLVLANGGAIWGSEGFFTGWEARNQKNDDK